MRAFVVTEFNQEPTFQNHPIPVPAPNEIRIRVHAAGLNFADLLMIKGSYQATPAPPFALGLELVGTVEALGTGVANVRIGQRVATQVNGGALAEFAVAPAGQCWSPPEDMDDATAAGFQIAYGTSYLSLVKRAQLRTGERLVVLGAAGGVGLTAVELGKVLGAEVVAVARGPEKLRVAKEAGASHLIDSTDAADLRPILKGMGGVNVVYDAVGGDLGEAAFGALSPGGRHLLIGFAGGKPPSLKLNHALVKNVDILGVYWGAYTKLDPALMADCLQDLAKLHSQNRISPKIDEIVPFDATAEALQRLRNREVSGKLVVQIHPAP